MSDFYDALETRDPAAREAALMAALPGVVAQAQAHSSAAAELLAGVDPREVSSREALARLPVLRKSELLQRQRERRHGDPFGGFSAIGWTGLPRPRGARRVFQSPGPLYEPEGTAPDWWRTARALYAAGFRSGDLLHNSFSYHLTPAGSIMECGAHALGCAVFAGGVGNTELQLQAIAELRPQGYVGTPSFLKILLERAAEQDLPLPGFGKALVSGEACPPSLQAFFAGRGVQAYQCYATADLGLIAYETPARQGLVVDEGVIVEIVQPGTGEPVAEGEIGEVVVTTLNPDYPLIRFGTGDLSAVLPGRCPSGRSNVRLRGWLGRADQATKVRGMFVHPGQLAQLAQRHPGLGRLRLVVSGEPAAERLLLRAEAQEQGEGLAQQLAASVREVTKLRAEVELCAPGSLPNDGKVIEDGRRYD
ncbi:phenylacetate--CoA ligase family protein [Azohydromonas caseinilytica]|uniref:Phenylacetate--CoA ligase n=1 Tax=Azohydromonas caseinilytica TaxID=2728836 RepID=A0A848F0A1_9BURK|nr:AMP-binding protein [Azohydromonas caseinilytica]NML13487.1 phenylacetate--CoA ligase [Azohydromonas caseinilytica]